MTDTPPASASFVADLSKTLGLPDDFLFRLLQDDDWSFLIKAHAFVEAALTHLLTVALRHPELERTFARLDTSDGRTGKVAFARGAHLLDLPAVKFVTKLSELRNLVIHDVKKVGFSLADWYASLDPKQKREFLTVMTFFATVAPPELGLSTELAIEAATPLASPSPKPLIWFNLCMFAFLVHHRSSRAQTVVELERLAIATILSVYGASKRA